VLSKQNPNAPRGFTSEALGAIASYQWPGNVRELENRMKRAVIMASGPLIAPADLDLAASTVNPTPLSLREIREQAEREAIQRALAQSDGNISQAAKLLGISRPTLYGLMNEFGMRT
jgi:two-component system NtrC family response regulator